MTIDKITTNDVNPEDEFSLKKLVGKKIISKSGRIVGTVQDIIIKNYSIIGIITTRSFASPLFIDKIYFDSFKEDAIILKIDPVTCIVGLNVFDKNGRKLGKVTNIIRETNNNEFSEFFVNQGPLKKELNFKHMDIETISQNVILNIEFDSK